MNRFIIGGILAAIVVALTGGLGRMFTESDSQTGLTGVNRNNNNNRVETGDLGSLPVEQAGQLVRRQSDVGTGTRTTPDFVGQDPGGRPDIFPDTTGATGTAGNVIPRTNQTTTFPTTNGDIAPIQPELVRPGLEQRPIEPDLDSIPALW
ncbi:MAG: hypothetical protein ACFCVB_13560 [Nodosilinea sp.]